MNFKNKLLSIFSFLLLIMPLNAFAYSKEVIPGGDNIGIELHSKGVLIVGFYKVDEHFIGKDAGFEIGDRIIKINNQEVHSISEMVDAIQEKSSSALEVTFIRANKEYKLNLTVHLDENNIYKTGLYVKDKINGIGTLTYIDPNTKIYGALGHEILEKTSMQKFEIQDGKIVKSEVTGIDKSERGTPGEKNARYYSDQILGTIHENEQSGIFGTYQGSLENKETVKVASIDEIKTGKAIIRTVIDGTNVKEFTINILRIDKKSETKNILFEITDSRLLEETGGVVQGMSGSPILQDNKLIGAVTHVIVNDSKKGYGIFITTMLEEGED